MFNQVEISQDNAKNPESLTPNDPIPSSSDCVPPNYSILSLADSELSNDAIVSSSNAEPAVVSSVRKRCCAPDCTNL